MGLIYVIKREKDLVKDFDEILCRIGLRDKNHVIEDVPYKSHDLIVFLLFEDFGLLNN